MTGTVLEEKEVCADPSGVRACIESFLGEQQQIPPMYSALKVNGRKLYELAREGKEVERKPRRVVFYGIDILEMNLPLVRFSVTCSKGTYIRTLCHDIGQKLGCGGCMESLLRTRVERFDVKDALKLSEVEKAAEAGTVLSHVVTIEQMFSQYGEIQAPACFDKMLRNGNAVPAKCVMEDGTRVRMYDSSRRFIGLYEFEEKKKTVSADYHVLHPGGFCGEQKGDTMIYTTDVPRLGEGETSAVTLGKFDGLHRGHQKLMNCIREKKEDNCKAVIFTFDVSPVVRLLHTLQRDF